MKLSTLVSITTLLPHEATTVGFLSRSSQLEPFGDKVEEPVPRDENLIYEATIKESIEVQERGSVCLCPEGQFWHSYMQECVKQGAEGYECGFFPAKHHHEVCQDGLICKHLEGSNTRYFHPGAVPATCIKCLPTDHCPSKNAEGCAKQYALCGRACATVRAKVAGSDSVAEATVCIEPGTVLERLGLKPDAKLGKEEAAYVVERGDALAVEVARSAVAAKARKSGAPEEPVSGGTTEGAEEGGGDVPVANKTDRSTPRASDGPTEGVSDHATVPGTNATESTTSESPVADRGPVKEIKPAVDPVIQRPRKIPQDEFKSGMP